MKITAQLTTLVVSLVVARVGALCDFSNGFQLLNETRMCLESIPVNETWIDNTVVTVLGTLQQYSFLDLYRSSGEPWNYEINTMVELESLWGQSFASDWEFQEALQGTIVALQDAHTVYSKPSCYGILAFLPFRMVPSYTELGDLRYVLEDRTVNGNSVTDALVPTLTDFIGWEIELIDGRPATAAVTQFADAHEFISNDRSNRFTGALRRRSFLTRDLSRYSLPEGDVVRLGLKEKTTVARPFPPERDPSLLTFIDVPWWAVGDPNVSSVDDFVASCEREEIPEVVPCPEDNSAARDSHAGQLGSLAEMKRLVEKMGMVAEEASLQWDRELRWQRQHERQSQSWWPWEEAGGNALARSLWLHGHQSDDGGEEEEEGMVVDEKYDELGVGCMHAWDGGSQSGLRGANGDWLRRHDISARLVQQAGFPVEQTSEMGDWEVDMDDRARTGLAVALFRPAEDAKDVFGNPLPHAVLLRIQTFNPATVSACFAQLQRVPCPSESVLVEVIACFFSRVEDFIERSVVRVHELREEAPDSLVLIDLHRNGGGNVLLGQLTMMHLSRPLFDDPRMLASLMEQRRSPLWLDMAEWIRSENISESQLSSFPLFGMLSPDFGEELSKRDKDGRWDFSWFTDGVYRRWGGDAYRMSELHRLSNVSEFLSFLDLPPPPIGDRAVDATKLLLLTDGLCGSMCAQVLRTLQDNHLGRVVGMDGHPALTSDGSSFAGGVIQSSGQVTAIVKSAQTIGYDLPSRASLPVGDPNRVYIPEFFVTTARFGINRGHALSLRRPAWPQQFDPRTPDGRIRAWPEVSMELSLYEDVLSISAGIAYPNADTVGRQRGEGFPSGDILPTFAVAILSVAGGVLLGMGLLAFITRCRSRSERQSRPPTQVEPSS